MTCTDCRDEPHQHISKRSTYKIHWVRCLVIATYKGKEYRAEHLEIASPDDYADPPSDVPVINEYMWSEGNYSCDCNRVNILGIKPEDAPDLFHIEGSFYSDGSGPVDKADTHERCGHNICVKSITPITCKIVQPLILDEEIDDDG